MTGVLVLVAVLLLSAVAGLVHRSRSGRFRSSASSLAPVLAELGAEPGDRATLLQFSSAFCAPCRATRRVLADVAGAVPGVTHVEVDAESHLELVRRVGVQRTPTTLILAADGGEVSRAAGALRKPKVLHALSVAVQP